MIGIGNDKEFMVMARNGKEWLGTKMNDKE
jgi:hypothetical protein